MICTSIRCLSTFLVREAALGTLANSVALYGVELADIQGRNLASVDTVAAKAVLGPRQCSRAKECLWGLLTKGFYVSPLWHVQYQRMLWLARQARTPGTTQTLVQEVLSEYAQPDALSDVGQSNIYTRSRTVPVWVCPCVRRLGLIQHCIFLCVFLYACVFSGCACAHLCMWVQGGP